MFYIFSEKDSIQANGVGTSPQKTIFNNSATNYHQDKKITTTTIKELFSYWNLYQRLVSWNVLFSDAAIAGRAMDDIKKVTAFPISSLLSMDGEDL